jgi:hypothetical protein
LTKALLAATGAKDPVRSFRAAVDLICSRCCQNLPKITSKYADLKEFLADAKAKDAPAVLKKADVLLEQLPDMSQKELERTGLAVGTAGRIAKLAKQFAAE